MSPPLTISYVADATNIHVSRWLSFFVARGYRVYCLSDKEGSIDGVTVVHLPNRNDLLAAERKNVRKTAVLRARVRAIREHLRTIKPDILHAIFLYHRGWSAALTGFHPLIITLLGSDIYLPRKNYRNSFHLNRDRLLNALSLRQSDMVTAVSFDLSSMADKLTMRITPVELIPIGTELSVFRPHLETTDLRERLNIPSDAFVVLSPRQMTPHYNQVTIIESIPRVLEEVPHAVFILKDTFCNTVERQAYVNSLKALTLKLGVNHAVRWVEEVTMDELPYYYNLADAVLSVPSTDGMPVTIFEAMACQKPLVVGDLSAYNEIIIHGQTGLRVPLRNAQALASAVIKLHRNPALAGRMVDESQVILHQYGIFSEQMMRMERYYHGLSTGRIESGHSLRKSINHWLLQLIVGLS